MMEHLLAWEEVVSRQPPPRRLPNARAILRAAHRRDRRKIAVLDDDPTGTQTVHDVSVYLDWNEPLIEEAITAPPGCFYLSTNSRGLSPELAANQAWEIGRMLALAGVKTASPVTVVSRSDSTLRGHFPEEVEALSEGLGQRPDGILLVPAFCEGGRFTLDDTHWVKLEGRTVRVAKTEYARDPHFGYHHSNLCEWVEEKTCGRVRASEVRSLSLDLIRNDGVTAVASALKHAGRQTYFVVNALEDADLEIVSLALLAAERAGKRFVLRCAASMVKVYAGIEDAPCLNPNSLALGGPGLILVGSYVHRTTKQVQTLLRMPGVAGMEASVDKLASDRPERTIRSLAHQVDTLLSQGKTTVLFTSRQQKALSGMECLTFGRRVMRGLTSTVKRLKVKPAFVVAKGGDTSHCVAAEGLSATRARVLGQIIPGVPVWELGTGAKWQGAHYIVFPGNVGGSGALAQVVAALSKSKSESAA